MDRLEDKYHKKIVPLLKKEFNITHSLAVPKVEKVVINMGVGELASDKGGREKAEFTLASITGQRPLKRGARIAIADFKIRKGNIVGLKVSLRRKRMYQFLDKLFTIALPRVRDFQGLKREAFDKQANYTVGLKEQIIFPEVDYDKIDKVRGLEITIVTSTKDKKKALRLLELLGLPFVKVEDKGKGE